MRTMFSIIRFLNSFLSIKKVSKMSKILKMNEKIIETFVYIYTNINHIIGIPQNNRTQNTKVDKDYCKKCETA